MKEQEDPNAYIGLEENINTYAVNQKQECIQGWKLG
jgi:hypothetical protein